MPAHVSANYTLQFVSVTLSVSASEWEELSATGPERGSMEDGLLRGLEQLAGTLCLQTAGILQVLAMTLIFFSVV